MSSTDHPVPDPDEPDAAADGPPPAAAPSRARLTRHGWLPWSAGAALTAAQLAAAIAAPGNWRTAAAIAIAVATAAAIGFALFGGRAR